ncbi:MAG TPA: metal ABC transporter ATP-binding protein [Ilumatobacteraceae bacterium]|nr:metal ABC transporter ATP-binding protein [Ilumatobacteraceae bacterium]
MTTSSTPKSQRGDTIEITDLSVDRGGTTALSIDALSIPRGVTALVGPNGSGKSTLLHVIAGLLAPAHGTVSVCGRRPAQARRDIAYVLQTQHASEHLLVTANEVVALARSSTLGPFRRLRRSDRDIVTEAMDRLEITTMGRRHLAEMSGGQRQRVFVAQGLAQDAEILLLDEPVAGLDAVSAQQIRTVIDDERTAGRFVLVATHDLDEARRADHVVLLNGRVVAAGAPADALRPEHLREAYGARVLDLGGQIVAVDDGVHHDDHDHIHHDHR